LVSAIRLRYPL